MLNNVAADTNIIFYLMVAAGAIGILSKIVSHITLSRMVRAAKAMPKSTHRLMKLVCTEYGHACMAQGPVNNALAFIRKYIYEYRGFLFRLHTWRQMEIQAVWLSGLLALAGAYGHYMAHGLCAGMYLYITLGAAEMAVLSVISQLSDEAYKIKGIEIYMTDYLENVCARRSKKIRQAEKEQIEIIRPKSVEAADPPACPQEQLSAQKEDAIRLILAEFLFPYAPEGCAQ